LTVRQLYTKNAGKLVRVPRPTTRND